MFDVSHIKLKVLEFTVFIYICDICNIIYTQPGVPAHDGMAKHI